MQGITKILLWALPAAVALSSCSGLSRIRVEEVRNVSVQPIGGGKMLVNMDVKVGNPSRRTVQLTMLELNVELGGALFATISAVKTIAVPPHNDAFLPVELELRLRNIISTMIMLQQRQISPE
ncbi:MAG: LEA type 2 family protein, partial [Prevotellaceae bacterium]|nr:LEA type 2 family protein [Prevotellaceae bacterium]